MGFKAGTKVYMVSEGAAVLKCDYEGCQGREQNVCGNADNGADVVIQCLKCGVMRQEATELLEMIAPVSWTRVPGGWVRKTRGGFYRCMVPTGFTFGPYATEREAKEGIESHLENVRS